MKATYEPIGMLMARLNTITPEVKITNEPEWAREVRGKIEAQGYRVEWHVEARARKTDKP